MRRMADAGPRTARWLAGGAILAAVAAFAVAVPSVRGAETAAARRLSPVSELAKGKFLVARKGLPDPNFARSVILLVQYNDEGAMGLIVNRPTEIKLSQLWPDMKKMQTRSDTFYEGGPVMRSAMLLLVRGETAKVAHPVLDDLVLSGDQEWLQEMIAGDFPRERLHVYSGHAGWAPGQLEWEVERGDWFIWPADAETVMSDEPGQEMWSRLLSHTESVLARMRATGPKAVVPRRRSSLLHRLEETPDRGVSRLDPWTIYLWR